MSKYDFNPKTYKNNLTAIFKKIKQENEFDKKKLVSILKSNPRDNSGIFSKDQLVQGYYYLVENKIIEPDRSILDRIKMKPTRSISGVLPLTVLTRPFPCPGKCIFCPNDVRMPKSYLSDEPGAQRAERNHFDPYLQTYNRLLAFYNTGHEVSKIELIILGGTWSYYPEKYQVWFIKRCFDALNDFGFKDDRSNIKTRNIYEKKEKSRPEIDPKTGKRISYNTSILRKEREMAKKKGLKNIKLDKDYSQSVNKETATWEELEAAHKVNESAKARCIGLVIETRPDHIDEKEVIRIRRLGATKTQIGYQSLQDKVLELNHRGHNVTATKNSVALVRSGGFKIHIHWMPNLYGSNPEKDKEDFLKIFEKGFVPDEVKIYPCSLIETAELMDYYNNGLWRPYTEEELIDVIGFAVSNTPRWVRLTRVIRDIPSQDIVVGNKKTNFRQIVDNHLETQGIKSSDIREREIREQEATIDELKLKITSYTGENIYGETEEQFLEYVTKDDKIAGFLRLSLPEKTKGRKLNLLDVKHQELIPIKSGRVESIKNKDNKTSNKHFIEELTDAAIIREIHVYGVAQSVGGTGRSGSSQHLGLGKKLIEKSLEIAREKKVYKKLSVISAIGTREYYQKRGFEDGLLYQHYKL